jgi:hypothetical protein
MRKIITEWESTKPNPDEKHLKAVWTVEIENLKRSREYIEKVSQRRRANGLAALKKVGLGHADVEKLVKEDAVGSMQFYKESKSRLVKPTIDIEALHKDDLKLAEEHEKRIKPTGNPAWAGYIRQASYGGHWIGYEGDAHEVPHVTWDVPANRLDADAHAWGKGCYDQDFSEIHAYLAFTIKPPSWGHLQIYTSPWLHGWFSLYSDDEWYNDVYTHATVDAWCDSYQHFWSPRTYQLQFNLGGPEIHPAYANRIDHPLSITHSRNVGEHDTVTIRVGIKIYCFAKASAAHSIVDFLTGDANYVWIPYVYWKLTQL